MNTSILAIISLFAMATYADPIIKQPSAQEVESGELNLDHHYYEGDIRLTPKQKSLLTQSNDGLHSRALTNQVERLWPFGVIPFVVNPSLRKTSKRYIKSAVQEWNSRTCIKLVPKTPAHEDYIEFVYEGGCSSNLGKVGGRQTISVGMKTFPFIDCQHGNIVHEIAHSVGFFHEHSRPDRNQYIKVKWNRVKPGFYLNFKKMPSSLIDSHGVGYDYDSITHYGIRFFSKNGKRTLITKQAVPANAHVGQRVKLSVMDVQQTNLLYNNCNGVVLARKNDIQEPDTSDKKEESDDTDKKAKNVGE